MRLTRIRFGVLAITLLLLASAAPAPAAPALMVLMQDDYFSPEVVSGVVGLNDAEWQNTGLAFHSARIDRGPEWFFMNLDEGQSDSVPLRYAGTFDYTCTYHVETMTGSLKVKPRAMQTSGPPGTEFSVVLASVEPSDDGYAFDVQRRRNGRAWSTPKRVETPSYTFTAKRAGRYDVRARLLDLATEDLGQWSPSVRLRAG